MAAEKHNLVSGGGQHLVPNEGRSNAIFRRKSTAG